MSLKTFSKTLDSAISFFKLVRFPEQMLLPFLIQDCITVILYLETAIVLEKKFAEHSKQGYEIMSVNRI